MAAEPTTIRLVRRISDLIDSFVGALCALIFGAMTLAVLIGVFYRYVLDSPLSWPEEVSRYLMIWGASLAISLGIKSGEHVGLTVLMERLNGFVAKFVLHGLVFLLVLAFQLVLFTFSIQMVDDAKFMQTLSLGITMRLPYAAVPVAMVFANLQLVLVFVLTATGHNDPTPATMVDL